MSRPAPPRGLAAVLAAHGTSAAGAPRGRRRFGLIALVGMPVVPLVLALIFGEGGRGEGFETFAKVVTVAYLGLILPLSEIFLGTGLFGDEWSGGTPHYVVGVPVSRLSLVLGRWLAGVRRSLVLLLPAIGVVYLLCLVRFEGALLHYLDEALWVLLIVSHLTLAYCALFMLFGLALRRAVMISLVYIFVFEMLIANLPQTFATLSLTFHARNALWHLTGNDAFSWTTLDVAGTEPVSLASSLIWLTTVTVVALVGCALVLGRKECGGEGAASDAAGT